MSENRNSRRSKKLIRESFIELLKEKKDINKISVKEIIDNADISKSTFYAHYQDIYAVLEEFENELIDEITSTIEEFFKDKKKDFDPYIKRLLFLFQENEKIYSLFFKTDIYVRLVEKIKKIIKNELSKYIAEELPNADNKTIDFTISFFTNGITYLMVDYFKNNLNLSLDEVAQKINDMLSEVMMSIKRKG
ncbi:MAG: TetR/AcrR family transcriptional regulator C-terminal domain-containing protein, partial [Firmicutes bacterium]|nr:TetR/AcrR family transcriptional regulator C-terminal domain-containing protein [Candidatus Colivicinus equi]